ncbi:MAG: hypothetical protein M3459_02125 [Actinomycetota bacterium]|nr:hypothetical protein [Actinomycetota bacterium]
MLQLAVSADAKVLWMITLGMGLVVTLVVILLVSLLSKLVNDIDVGVDSLWTVTKRLAQNTTGLYQLAGTGSVLRALREELIRHDKLLSEGPEDR